MHLGFHILSLTEVSEQTFNTSHDFNHQICIYNQHNKAGIRVTIFEASNISMNTVVDK